MRNIRFTLGAILGNVLLLALAAAILFGLAWMPAIDNGAGLSRY